MKEKKGLRFDDFYIEITLILKSRERQRERTKEDKFAHFVEILQKIRIIFRMDECSLLISSGNKLI